MPEQIVRNLPSEFIEALGKTYGTALTDAYGKPTDTSAYAPQVAPESLLQAEARGLAPGLGGYAPYITGAASAADPATAYQTYMSPYQQDIIDTTMQEYDLQSQKGLPALRAQAIGAGAFGGGREGVVQSEYQSASDRNRGALHAQLLGQGYTQAQQLRQQAMANQMNLAQAVPALRGQQIAGLGALGTQQQAQAQAQLDATRIGAQTAAFEPIERLSRLGTGVASLISGYPAREQMTSTPSPSALSTGLGTASTLAGIYKMLNPQPTNINFNQTGNAGVNSGLASAYSAMAKGQGLSTYGL